MGFKKLCFACWFCVLACLSTLGCSSSTRGNVGNLQSYQTSNVEAQWIIEGLPIIYNEEKWFPMDGTETLLDSEVYLLGEYNKVQFFADKEDVKPYNRLYTKFGNNKFRYFEQRKK